MKRSRAGLHYVNNVVDPARDGQGSISVLILGENPSAASTSWISQGIAGAVGDRVFGRVNSGGRALEGFPGKPLLRTFMATAKPPKTLRNTSGRRWQCLQLVTQTDTATRCEPF